MHGPAAGSVHRPAPPALGAGRRRPHYPGALFAYLASLAPGRERAWDCATGNGQAAIALARHFGQVIATDASAAQIANATPHERVDYRVEPVEASSIEARSVDLITVGTAVHWFDFESFYQEVRRVGTAGAVLAVWTYFFPAVTPAVDSWLQAFYWQALQGYWPARIRYLEERYRTLPFPFPEIEPPEIYMEAHWDLRQFAGFISTWSAVRAVLEEDGGKEALQAQFDGLQQAWGRETKKRLVRWPLHMRIGRLESPNASTPSS